MVGDEGTLRRRPPPPSTALRVSYVVRMQERARIHTRGVTWRTARTLVSCCCRLTQRGLVEGKVGPRDELPQHADWILDKGFVLLDVRAFSQPRLQVGEITHPARMVKDLVEALLELARPGVHDITPVTDGIDRHQPPLLAQLRPDRAERVGARREMTLGDSDPERLDKRPDVVEQRCLMRLNEPDPPAGIAAFHVLASQVVQQRRARPVATAGKKDDALAHHTLFHPRWQEMPSRAHRRCRAHRRTARANGIGDLIVTEPALSALRAAYPTATITLITSEYSVALLRGRPFPVDEVIAAPLVPGVRAGVVGMGGLPDDPPEVVERFCARMRARKLDLAVQLHGGGASSNALLRRLGARVTAGSRAQGAPPLDRTVTWSPFQHEILRWLEVVGLVGAAPVHLQPRLIITAADRVEAARALVTAGAGGDGAPLVALHPGATDPRRRRPPQRLAAVGNALAAQGAHVVLLGGPSDQPLVDAMRATLQAHASDLTGRLSLSGLVGVLERAALFVGNDSGPRHLAEAAGTSTVGIFTKANLVDVAPLFRASHHVVVSWASTCAICGLDFFEPPCRHEATVLDDVQVEDVVAPAVELLRAGRDRKYWGMMRRNMGNGAATHDQGYARFCASAYANCRKSAPLNAENRPVTRRVDRGAKASPKTSPVAIH
jgi:ADP-heptose:LPS heptosyltransferase